MANPLKILTVLTASQAAKFEQGLDVNSQKLTNVAAGTVSSDGVNYGQLTAASSDMKSYVDAQDSALSGAFDTRLVQLSGASATALAGEVAARIAADTALSGNLASEVAARIAADSALSGAFDTRLIALSGAAATALAGEATARIAGDAELSGNLAAEVTARIAAVSAEAAARQAADTTLQSNITAEYNRAVAAEGALSGALAAEVARATGVESGLSSSLAAEISRATAAEGVLQSNIDVEKGRIDAILSASNADYDTFKEVVDLINSVDATNDSVFAGWVLQHDADFATYVTGAATALQNEVTRATGVEAQLSGALATEISARVSADAAMKTAYDSLRFVQTGSLVGGSVVVSFASEGANFVVAQMGNIALDVMVDADNTGYTNDLVAVKMFSDGGDLKVQIDAPATPTAKYRLIAVNEKKGGLN